MDDMGFPVTPRSMTLHDLELLWGQILLEFRDIFRVSEAIIAKVKQMKIRVRTIMWKPDSPIVDTRPIGQNNRPMR